MTADEFMDTCRKARYFVVGPNGTKRPMAGDLEYQCSDLAEPLTARWRDGNLSFGFNRLVSWADDEDCAVYRFDPYPDAQEGAA